MLPMGMRASTEEEVIELPRRRRRICYDNLTSALEIAKGFWEGSRMKAPTAVQITSIASAC
jgi:hypothetical protein